MLAWLSATGSTRSVALIRIGLALVIWTRFGNTWVLFRNMEHLVLSLLGFAVTAAMLVGWHSRLASALTGAVLLYGYYVIGEDYVHHHTYLLAVAPCLLALTACGGSYSVDRWRAVQRAAQAEEAPPPESGPTWALSLLTLQVAMVYFWGAWDKTSLVYLSGTGMQQYAITLYFGSGAADWWWFKPLMCALAIGSVLLEYALVIGMWFSRTRGWVLAAGAIFHAIIFITMPVRTFSVTMWVLYLAIFPPEQVHRVIDQLSEEPGQRQRQRQRQAG
jgi:hypothetical protein